MKCLTIAVDCPVVHLTEADGLGTAEKAAAYDAFLNIEGIERESAEN